MTGSAATVDVWRLFFFIIVILFFFEPQEAFLQTEHNLLLKPAVIEPNGNKWTQMNKTFTSGGYNSRHVLRAPPKPWVITIKHH